MLTATLSHHFSAGHRIIGLVGPGAKCSNIHGHTFGVEWTVQLPDITAAAVEFAAVKALLRGYVDKALDHGFLVHKDDLEMGNVLLTIKSKHLVMKTRPTTEAIATLIAEESQKLLGDVRLLEVRVSEGPHNAATWTRGWHSVPVDEERKPLWCAACAAEHEFGGPDCIRRVLVDGTTPEAHRGHRCSVDPERVGQ